MVLMVRRESRAKVTLEVTLEGLLASARKQIPLNLTPISRKSYFPMKFTVQIKMKMSKVMSKVKMLCYTSLSPQIMHSRYFALIFTFNITFRKCNG